MYKKIIATIIISLVILTLGTNIAVSNHGNTYKDFSKVSHVMTNGKLKLVSNKDTYNSLADVRIKQRYNFVNLSKPTLVAHRGASSIAPENSIPAIDEAAKIGYWGVELDICSSSDGTLYLLHDGMLDRTTNGHGLITTKSSHQIDRLIVNKGANISSYPDLRLPRFKDALVECRKDNLIPVFDIKYLSEENRDLNTFLKIIYKYGDEKKLLVHAFNYKYLEYLRSKDKQIILMPMVDPQSIIYGYNYIKSFGFTGVDSNIDYLNKKIVQQAHRDGLKVFCWTVDTPLELNKALNLGVDFIYSDTFYPNDIKSLKKTFNSNQHIKPVHKASNRTYKL
ncbi:glycerophosphodiester phosphodiesterase [Clostridium sp. WILCCON 0269]|uniref:Glycerophosphodiester phosphodiesterase n=1 Tax=Candidatus Clostridium eludens TaxID=3381663 RepID=A0ABW8SHA8_9CLOT